MWISNYESSEQEKTKNSDRISQKSKSFLDKKCSFFGMRDMTSEILASRLIKVSLVTMEIDLLA